MNGFYNDFDHERLVDVPPRHSDYRSAFQTDRDRIIYTSAFRRLQAKTQVFLSGEFDFYRTRLTHSLEVAQIGRSICEHLQKDSELLGPDFHVDTDLVEAVCLAHDLGHPPFGHAGERTLQRLMRGDAGGFEGNAQSLRIVTRLIYSSGDEKRGMNPTRAFLDGILKYKSCYDELPDPENHFLYEDQKELVQFVNGGAQFPAEAAPGVARDACKSIECQIMDWADDTAYSLNDVVDSVRAGFLRFDRIESWGANAGLDTDESGWLAALLESLRSHRTQSVFGRKIGDFIVATGLERTETFLSRASHRHAYRLVIDPLVRKEARFYKRLAVELVFRSLQIHQLEYKGDYILTRIFQTLAGHYLSGAKTLLLPEPVHARIRNEISNPAKQRLVCDYVAGMTDGFAVRTYKRLFDPEFGSIADLV